MKRFFSLSAVTVALLSSLLLVVSSFAQTREVRSIRCGTNVVSLGAHSSELNQKCGEPDQKERIEARLTAYEIWTYNCGSGRFMKVITISGGKVHKIEEGARGSGPTRCQ
jgi:hypothetical protein